MVEDHPARRVVDVRHLYRDRIKDRPRANPADARSSLVALTDEGLQVLAEARRRNAAVVSARLEADPRHSVADLADAVGLLRHLLEDHPDESRDDL